MPKLSLYFRTALSQLIARASEDLVDDAVPPVQGCQVILMKADFDPETLTSEDVVAGTFWASNGLTGKMAAPGEQLEGIDENGNYRISLKGPEEGGLWRWEVDSLPAGDEKIYGYFVKDRTGGEVLWAEKYDEPVSVVEVGQIHQIPDVGFALDISAAE